MDHQVKENELKVKFYNHIIKKYSNLELEVTTLDKFILECSLFVDIEESESIVLLEDKYNEFQYLNSIFNWEYGTNIDLQKEWTEFKNNTVQEYTKDIDTINLF